MKSRDPVASNDPVAFLSAFQTTAKRLQNYEVVLGTDLVRPTRSGSDSLVTCQKVPNILREADYATSGPGNRLPLRTSRNVTDGRTCPIKYSTGL